MVWPAICCEGACAASLAAAASSEPLTPSLNPFTAPPRSWPILRSFLVPKIRTTTSNTISQCQILSPPMIALLVLVSWQHPTQRFGSAQDMYMQMLHVLPADAAGVDNGPVAVRGA